MKLILVISFLLVYIPEIISQQLPSLPSLPDLDNLTAIYAVKKIDLPSLPDVSGVTGKDCVCAAGCSALPVTLLKFAGSRIDDKLVELQWNTENEINNKGFFVERSLGDVNNFNSINFVPAIINQLPVKKYNLPDTNNFSGTSFYRLRQADMDGSFKFSETIAVKGYLHNSYLDLYPNPANEKITILVNSLHAEEITIMVTDAAMKTMLIKRQNAVKGINTIPLNISSFTSGSYIVKIVGPANGIFISRFIVQ